MLAGSFAATPLQGGAAWAVLQYALGLEQLGHDVVLVDESPDGQEWPRFRSTLTRAGYAGDAALLCGDRRAKGMTWTALSRWATGADMLLNLGGALRSSELLDLVRHRVYVDLDPAFTQLWHSVEDIDMGLDAHHTFVTVGRNLGTAASPIPTCSRFWIATVPPVVLDRWRFADCVPRYGLTTVANWRSYGSIHHGGVVHGQKAHSFREFADLPGRLRSLGVALEVEPALCIDPAETSDLDLLRRHGWTMHDPLQLTASIDQYQRFVGISTMEIGIAKSGYVRSQSGWFSDRSVAYLASGRPVVAQDTGWSAHLPAGKGLLAFSDPAGAAAAVAEVWESYDVHRRAGRDLAEAYFDSRTVLTDLLEAAAR